MTKPSKRPDLILGPLPTGMINRVLRTELDPGQVIFTRGAQVHANRRHPEDFPVALPHLGTVVTQPLFVGQDFRNPGKFELVGRLPAELGFLLVALVMERDASGHYHVASLFRISEKKVETRRQTGILKPVVWA